MIKVLRVLSIGVFVCSIWMLFKGETTASIIGVLIASTTLSDMDMIETRKTLNSVIRRVNEITSDIEELKGDK